MQLAYSHHLQLLDAMVVGKCVHVCVRQERVWAPGPVLERNIRLAIVVYACKSTRQRDWRRSRLASRLFPRWRTRGVFLSFVVFWRNKFVAIAVAHEDKLRKAAKRPLARLGPFDTPFGGLFHMALDKHPESIWLPSHGSRMDIKLLLGRADDELEWGRRGNPEACDVKLAGKIC